MLIENTAELSALREICEIVAFTLKSMIDYAQPGMSAFEVDAFGENILKEKGARSAPQIMYDFPGATCISINHEVAHGIPFKEKILREGDLINIDVSAAKNGFFGDNGASFVLGNDHFHHQQLVDASKLILKTIIQKIKPGIGVAEIGKWIHQEAKIRGYKVIKNLAGHGIGRSLHEKPKEIPCYYDRFNLQRLRENDVIAVETFISTKSEYAVQGSDDWTLICEKGGYVAQHEHTLVVRKNAPLVLTLSNQIFS